MTDWADRGKLQAGDPDAPGSMLMRVHGNGSDRQHAAVEIPAEQRAGQGGEANEGRKVAQPLAQGRSRGVGGANCAAVG